MPLVLLAFNVMHREWGIVTPNQSCSCYGSGWAMYQFTVGWVSLLSHNRANVSFRSPGGAVGFLAFNALFVLVKNIKLYENPEQHV